MSHASPSSTPGHRATGLGPGGIADSPARLSAGGGVHSGWNTPTSSAWTEGTPSYTESSMSSHGGGGGVGATGVGQSSLDDLCDVCFVCRVVATFTLFLTDRSLLFPPYIFILQLATAAVSFNFMLLFFLNFSKVSF